MNINEPKGGGGFVLPFLNTNKRKEKEKEKAFRTRSSRSSMTSNRLPFLNWVPDNIRNHFVATSAEFTGTTLFLFFAFSGTQVALLAEPQNSANEVGTLSNPSQLTFIALSFGFSLAVNAWVFFRISGGLFNPAVTLGMCLVGALPYIRGICLTVAQILGGITAAAICSALFPGPLTVRTNLGGGTSVVQGLFIEMFLSAELVFTIFMLAAEKHKGTFIAPIGIGLSLFIAELTGVYFTGGSVNPARSFGPSVVSHKFHSYHWIYWVGPILGAILASGFYKFIKSLEYETANPGQDRSKPEGEHFDPDLDSSNPRVSFAPEDYAERGLHGPDMNGTSGNLRRIGTPKEYGSGRRPFSDSPASPHPNDQFSGLADGGMHANEDIKRTVTSGSGSDQTLGRNSVPHTGAAAQKSSIKPGSRGSQYTNGHEGSVRTNTHNNKNLGGGIPGDEDFYDKA
ncbi:related to aquaporin [Phialocephala subalpina]|uniref:Related to aquaporin n=1 Tax=Phialocephala subalpina TaxID=576137 RepID=A0A1L7XFZ8_9HELO|nr:related to aquaporin [Phialocephala subalpina]